MFTKTNFQRRKQKTCFLGGDLPIGPAIHMPWDFFSKYTEIKSDHESLPLWEARYMVRGIKTVIDLNGGFFSGWFGHLQIEELAFVQLVVVRSGRKLQGHKYHGFCSQALGIVAVGQLGEHCGCSWGFWCHENCSGSRLPGPLSLVEHRASVVLQHSAPRRRSWPSTVSVFSLRLQPEDVDLHRRSAIGFYSHCLSFSSSYSFGCVVGHVRNRIPGLFKKRHPSIPIFLGFISPLFGFKHRFLGRTSTLLVCFNGSPKNESIHSLKLTAKAPENRPLDSKRKDRLPTIFKIVLGNAAWIISHTKKWKNKSWKNHRFNRAGGDPRWLAIGHLPATSPDWLMKVKNLQHLTYYVPTAASLVEVPFVKWSGSFGWSMYSLPFHIFFVVLPVIAAIFWGCDTLPRNSGKFSSGSRVAQKMYSKSWSWAQLIFSRMLQVDVQFKPQKTQQKQTQGVKFDTQMEGLGNLLLVSS